MCSTCQYYFKILVIALRYYYSHLVKSSLSHSLLSLNCAYWAKASIGDLVEANSKTKNYFASYLLGVTTLLVPNAV
jgi:hypothetical protein